MTIYVTRRNEKILHTYSNLKEFQHEKLVVTTILNASETLWLTLMWFWVSETSQNIFHFKGYCVKELSNQRNWKILTGCVPGPCTPWGRRFSATHQKGTGAAIEMQCQQGGRAVRGTRAVCSWAASTAQTSGWAAASWRLSGSACCCHPAPSHLEDGGENEHIWNIFQPKEKCMLHFKTKVKFSIKHLVGRFFFLHFWVSLFFFCGEPIDFGSSFY